MEHEAISPWFSWWGRELAGTCRRLGLVVPAFRSPPAVDGVDRTVRRWPDGDGVTIAVRLWSRPLAAIRADMIDGVLVANALTGDRAEELRAILERAAPAPEQAA